MNDYVKRKVIYTNDGRLLDENGKSIMMDWEKPIMEFQAKQISKPQGDILNIGYGMGFTDFEIENHSPKTHSIIEIHPDVQDKIMELGWYKKNHVKLYFGDWKFYLDKLPRFDGIYFDTWDDNDLLFLFQNIRKILKVGGKITFFNNPKDDKKKLKYPNYLQSEIEKNFDLVIEQMEIPFIDSPYRQTGDPDSCYWSPFWKTYYSPILTLF